MFYVHHFENKIFAYITPITSFTVHTSSIYCWFWLQYYNMDGILKLWLEREDIDVIIWTKRAKQNVRIQSYVHNLKKIFFLQLYSEFMVWNVRIEFLFSFLFSCLYWWSCPKLNSIWNFGMLFYLNYNLPWCLGLRYGYVIHCIN